MKKLFTLLTLLFTAFIANAQQYKTGCNFDAEKYGSVPQAATLTTRSFDNLPAAFSLRKYCPTPSNQGQQSSCVGWATAYAARTILESIANKRINASSSANEAFSPSFVYNQIKQNDGCNKSSHILDALILMYEKGNLKLKRFPYICDKKPQFTETVDALNYKIADAIRLSSTNSTFSSSEKITIKNAIKNAIANKSPVVFGMNCFASFQELSTVWNGVKDQNLGGHAMCIIGYDDNKYGGAFEVMNSWGTNWGENGFVWIKYDDLLSNAHEIYQVIGSDMPAPNPVVVVNPPKPIVVEPKPNPKPPKPVVVEPNPKPLYNMEGSIRLVKDDGSEIALQRGSGMRDFDIEEIEKIEKPVYQSVLPIQTGDRFRIYFKAEYGAYIYIISYGSVSQKAKPIYPFRNFSAYLNGGNSEVAIPNENFYIKVDDKVGTDFLTFVYSLKPINIEEICNTINNTDGSYISRMKQAFTGKILLSKDVTFTLPKAGFVANTNGRSVLPFTIQFEHQ
jgi:C1A family cysteine protease